MLINIMYSKLEIMKEFIYFWNCHLFSMEMWEGDWSFLAVVPSSVNENFAPLILHSNGRQGM